MRVCFLSAALLTTLLLTGCGDPWTSMGGGNNHLGQNMSFQGDFDQNPEWTTNLPGFPHVHVSPMVSSGIRTIYLTTTKGRNMLHGIHRWDGQIGWSYDFGNVLLVGYPALLKAKLGDQSNGDRVYVAVSESTHGDQGGQAVLYCFDARQGTAMTGVDRLLWQTSFQAPVQIFWSPIVTGGRVYLGGGPGGGLLAFDASTGSPLWQQSYAGPGVSWSPSTWGRIYTFTSGQLRRHNPVTGSEDWMMALPAGGTTNGTYPVIWGTTGFLVSEGELRNIRLSNQTVQWATAGESYTGVPAYDVSRRQVYALNAFNALPSAKLDARDGLTGNLLWEFAPGERILSHTIMAQDFIYVATRDWVYGLDPQDGTVQWQGPTGMGSGAVRWLLCYGRNADGRLFVAGDGGIVRSFLKQP